MGRLAGLDAGLHQVHVRLHALDTRVAELSRGLRQLREVAGDTRDALQALKEAQSRSEREHGRLEGESHRAGRGKRDDPGQMGDWWQKGSGKVRKRREDPGCQGRGGSCRFGVCWLMGRVNAGSRRACGEERSPQCCGAETTLAAPRPLQSRPNSLAPPLAALTPSPSPWRF